LTGLKAARLAGAGLALALLGYAALGLYSVDTDESAVAFVLGRARPADILPGIHWNPPWPFGRVVVAKTATSFVMPVGYRMAPRPGAEPISDLWLTGDTNVVAARVNVQYTIESLRRFLLAQEDPRELVRSVGERVFTRVLLASTVDDVLGMRRAALRLEVHRGIQESLDAEGVGIAVQSITLEELAPPSEGRVRDAFQAVQNARSDRERTELEAESYRRQALARARGEAQKLRSEARAARHRRIEIARGETQRFRALAREHARAPAVTEERLYLESLERLLPGLETYVVEPGDGGRVNLRVVE